MTRPQRPASPRTNMTRPVSPVAARSSAGSARPRAGRPASASGPTARSGAVKRKAAAAATSGPSSASVTSAIGGAPRWVSGLLAGLQAALLSLSVVVTPSLAAFVASSADPANAKAGWPRSVAVGAALWLMGHGASVEVDGVVVTIVPLGITAVALFAAHASARRTAQPFRSAWLAGVGGYLVALAIVVLAVGDAGPLGAGGASVVRTVVGGTAVAAVGLASGVVRPSGWSRVAQPVLTRVPALVRAGLRGGLMVTALLVCVASVVVGVWAVAGWTAAGDVVEGLGLDGLSALLLAVAQLAIAPNLVVWGVGWLAGPGFVVGEGTMFAPSEVVSGPMPALPVLSALPGDAGGVLSLAPLVVVAVGCLVGSWLHRRVPPSTWCRPFLASGCAALVAGGTTGALVALAGGSIGPGRLAVVGSTSLLVGEVVAGLALVGSLLVMVPADLRIRAAVGGVVRRGPSERRSGRRRGRTADPRVDDLARRAARTVTADASGPPTAP
jgi:hypothetical protein